MEQQTTPSAPVEASQREIAIRIRKELGDPSVADDLGILTARLTEADPVLATWVENRLHRLHEDQTRHLAKVQREHDNVAGHLADLGMRLRTNRGELQRARQRREELAPDATGHNLRQFSREQLEAVAAYPAFYGFTTRRRPWTETYDLAAQLRFLIRRNDDVYDFGDWNLRLLPYSETEEYNPRLYPVRSGRTDGRTYWHCYDGYFEFNLVEQLNFQQHIRAGQLVPVFDVAKRGLLGVGRSDEVLQYLNIIKDPDPARVMPYDR